MWEYEHSIETTAGRDALWELWADVARWPDWNAGVATIRADGPFAVGTRITMTPPGEDAVELRLAEVEPGELFVDVMDAGDFTVRTTHRLTTLDGGRTRIGYRTEIDGPAADRVGPELGPAITADFPDVLAALAALAESRAPR